ncbi:hypothetical protein ACMX2H_11500 [Arthrobacter sulfonylureivorans]|uniref:hypothetical protein n=1 Tax=Arthrobacter sulfonylureivorans TaxID=2486855 RepID=UPI0039E35CD5
MQIKTLAYKSPTVETVLFTGHNGEELARWCRGKLCGMLLDPTERIIKIQTHRDGEIDVEVGDTVVKRSDGRFIRYTENEMGELLKEGN